MAKSPDLGTSTTTSLKMQGICHGQQQRANDAGRGLGVARRRLCVFFDLFGQPLTNSPQTPAGLPVDWARPHWHGTCGDFSRKETPAMFFERGNLMSMGAGICLRLAAATIACAAMLASPASVHAADKVTFYEDWFPEVEHGGAYQAVATGIYNSYGIDMDMQPGGPQVNGSLLLLGGKADFVVLHTDGELLHALEQGAPLVAIAAQYQKDPQVVLSHKGVGHDTMESLKGVPILLSQDSFSSFWPWLKKKYNYTDDQVRPYTFQMAPFLSDKAAVQQAYLTAEPYAIKQGGVDPNIFLLSDYGWDTYAALLVTRADVIKKNPDLVKRMTQATIEGWYSFWQNPKPGSKLVQEKANTPDGQIAYSIGEMKARGIVLSGDALTAGIGTMNDERWKSFYDAMVKAGLYKPGLDYRKAYTTEFINDKAFIAKMMAKYPEAVKNGSP
jgi:NitT/TauT family transport system substrate-binding protein